MKEELLRLTRQAVNPLVALHLGREYLQARVLLAMQEAGAMIPLAFQGGTALRFLFDVPRFSEDLGFALERPERGFDLAGIERRIAATLAREGYEVVTSHRAQRAVHRVMLAFPGLPHAAGLSAHPSRHTEVQTDVRPRLETLMRTAIEDLDSADDSVRREAAVLLNFGAELIPVDVSPEPVAWVVRSDSGLAADAMSVLERVFYLRDSAQVEGFAREFISHPDERVREAARAMLRSDP